jgi:CBS-domain-containing membrane protein
MTVDVETVEMSSSLTGAASKMWQADCGALPVIDDQRRVVGMVTDRDIAMAAMHHDLRLAEILVGEVMARKVVTCRAEDILARAAQVMRQYQVRRLPVVDVEQRLVGLLSINDLFRLAMPPPEGGPSADEVTLTMALVGRSRRPPRRAAARPVRRWVASPEAASVA